MVHIQRDKEFIEWKGNVGCPSNSSPRSAFVMLDLNFLKGQSRERKQYMHGTKGTTSFPLPMLGEVKTSATKVDPAK